MGKPCEDVSSNKKEPGRKMGRATTEPRFKPKKGSMIPSRRRLVKRMMFDELVQSLASVFGSVKKQASAAAPKASNVNDKAVFPYP
ncbi:Filaggrin-2 like [Melia azedarach]|uniref:Filaggrin-2 like n=1 Tax=Melia azedarach TaxID=155640 RepID=A0ACC1WNS2_MELAZ|nr:Filaggrin-2 like [Melia azedarach]